MMKSVYVLLAILCINDQVLWEIKHAQAFSTKVNLRRMGSGLGSGLSRELREEREICKYHVGMKMTETRSSPSGIPGLDNDEELDSMKKEIELLRAEAMKRMKDLSEHAAEAEDKIQHSSKYTQVKNVPVTWAQDQPKGNHKYTPDQVKSVWEHDPPHQDSVAPLHNTAPELSQLLSFKAGEPTLEDTYWKVQLNIGREPGTWMPKTWGASGERLLLNLEVHFTDEQLYSRDEFLMGLGNARICRVVNRELAIAPTMTEGSKSIRLKDGGWRIAKGEGPMGTDLLRFFIEAEEDMEIRHSGSDVYVPPGKIYCSCGYFKMHRPSGIKDDLRDQMQALEGKAAELDAEMQQEPLFSMKRIKISKELFEFGQRAKALRKAIAEADVVEPDKSLLRMSRRGDVGLTREGGVCCKVRKGPVAEYHILGRFSVASVDPPKQEEIQSLEAPQ